jgi:hypothetical protein
VRSIVSRHVYLSRRSEVPLSFASARARTADDSAAVAGVTSAGGAPGNGTAAGAAFAGVLLALRAWPERSSFSGRFMNQPSIEFPSSLNVPAKNRVPPWVSTAKLTFDPFKVIVWSCIMKDPPSVRDPPGARNIVPVRFP